MGDVEITPFSGLSSETAAGDGDLIGDLAPGAGDGPGVGSDVVGSVVYDFRRGLGATGGAGDGEEGELA